MRLGVNIDHVATIRQARRIDIPDPVEAAVLAELAGADGITVHLREDRRHIQDRDVRILRQTVKTKLNLELADVPEIVAIALEVKPEDCCVVPERRQEITTEGGLDVRAGIASLGRTVPRLTEGGIRVSLFVAPDPDQIRASADSGAAFVELHTGRYAEARGESARAEALRALGEAVDLARGLGLRVNAGHGLNYVNVRPVAALPEIEELNIGHAIIARAVLVGLDRAVREMKTLMWEARER
ncbi:MAG: pyridoxine 5'-phosphate synthase [Planctomycetes bacterium]|jgi:pyridoxine 5-phosphate synthase|nr:pyridoxine 5'-phosphate synthase [Planctomycetota bacterium]